jgi:hypothetical protein
MRRRSGPIPVFFEAKFLLGIFLVLSGIVPSNSRAVDVPKPPDPARMTAEIEELQKVLLSKRAALDSLLQSQASDADSLRDIIQIEIEAMESQIRQQEDLRQELEETLVPAPRPPRPPSRRKMVAYNMIRFGEDVEVRPDEVVNGDAIIVGGDLVVEGEVEGDAIVLAGNLYAGRHAHIRGQAIAIGGRVETGSGAEIQGQTVSLTLFPRRLPWLQTSWPGWVALVLDVLKLGFLVLVSGLLLLLVPARVQRARELLGQSFLRCLAVGLLVLMGGSAALTVAMILLAVTLIGIPAALVLAFAVGILLVASLLVGALLIGDRFQELLNRPVKAPLVSVLLGLFLVMLPELLADVLHLAVPPVLRPFGFGLVSTALVLTVLSAGLGALVLTRFGGGVPRQRAQATG